MASEHSTPPKQDTFPTETLRGGLDGVDKSMQFLPSHKFVMSCGTVTIDLKQGKILLVFNTRFRIWQIPKGRRNIGETMIDAAFRETHEETGWRPRPLSVKMLTRASRPRAERGGEKIEVEKLWLDNEPIAACTYPCPQSKEVGVLKTVYYFPAAADSTAAPESDTQEPHERLEPHWVNIADVIDKLTFAAEKSVIAQAFKCLRESGYKIGEEEINPTEKVLEDQNEAPIYD